MEVGPTVFAHAMHATEARMALPKEHRSAHLAQMAKDRWAHYMHILDDKLKGREYMLGSSFSLVNVANASLVGFATMMAGLPLSEQKDVAAWVARCQQRPAMARVMAG